MRKNKNYIALFSIIPGLGYLYIGNFRKMVIMWIATIGIILSYKPEKMFMNLMLILGLYCISVLDAIEQTKKIKSKNTIKKAKDPYFSLCLSILFDGAGQYYNGENKKAILFAVGGIYTYLILYVLFKFTLFKIEIIHYGYLLLSIVVLYVKILGCFDAYYTAYHYNLERMKL